MISFYLKQPVLIGVNIRYENSQRTVFLTSITIYLLIEKMEIKNFSLRFQLIFIFFKLLALSLVASQLISSHFLIRSIF